MPPISPVHPIAGLGCQVHVEPAAYLDAAVTPNGEVVRSPPLYCQIETYRTLRPGKLQPDFRWH
jgi:hypothetical protein